MHKLTNLAKDAIMLYAFAQAAYGLARLVVDGVEFVAEKIKK